MMLSVKLKHIFENSWFLQFVEILQNLLTEKEIFMKFLDTYGTIRGLIEEEKNYFIHDALMYHWKFRNLDQIRQKR